MRKFIFILVFFFSRHSQSQVTFKWLGTSGFTLTDQATTLVFDPAITRLGPLDFLPFRTVQTDKSEVDYWMNRCGVNSVQGTFVNHAHTDHVIDAPYLVKRFGGKLYGSSSVVNVGLGQGLTANQVQRVGPGENWQIGDFTIQPYVTPHAPHLLDIMIMDGHIDKPLGSPTSAWNYLVGDTFSYLIIHPKGKILFQAIGRVELNDPLSSVRPDVLLLTIANRISSDDLIYKRVIPSGAKTIIPLHHDNLFYKMKRSGSFDELWGVKTDEFKAALKKNAVHTKAQWPNYCSEIILFN